MAIQPSTGAILALASYPTFNPNALTTFDGTQLDKIDEQLLRDPAQPLLNRATQETYPPGSSFKIVTSSAAFSHRGEGREPEHAGARPDGADAAERQPPDQRRRRGLR